MREVDGVLTMLTLPASRTIFNADILRDEISLIQQDYEECGVLSGRPSRAEQEKGNERFDFDRLLSRDLMSSKLEMQRTQRR